MTICPKCNEPSVPTVTRYGVRYDHCGLWAWGDLAQLVDRATHDARQDAHRHFDPLWKSGGMSRSAAYKTLARELGIARKDCHIKLMDAATALRVRGAAERIHQARA